LLEHLVLEQLLPDLGLCRIDPQDPVRAQPGMKFGTAGTGGRRCSAMNSPKMVARSAPMIRRMKAPVSPFCGFVTG
jgi:hypothetical protein